MKKKSYAARLRQNIKRHKGLYLMILPVVAFYLVFCYYPMYGAQIAFRDYTPKLGVFHSPWAGLRHFREFFDSVYFGRLIRNTISINLKNLIFGFPAPILFALLLNEVKGQKFKKVVQTVSYMPHFISTVVIAGMILQFTATDGVLTWVMTLFGYPKQNMMLNPDFFQPVYVISDIWQSLGWGSIIYIAAISGINAELYEAARMDGAGRFKQMWHVTLPGILPTIITMFILRVGNMMNLGFEKIILLYNSSVYETADVISTYVYRKGLVDQSYSFSTAVGLFNSLINLLLLFLANKLCKRLTEHSLW
ncbi:MAG TPA: ABC transporter permease subunit [Candidatus Eisenbergiella merdavium]|uniref:ABC transporter permease subunit n=1 Tax=Candidatus Eisenbergiella merdavium TaxID=2838551 RepID=A0A9D2NDG4_9FIRM|nr:ABC transporter permease subunit [Candidatus Eisenbergiella merdavium]